MPDLMQSSAVDHVSHQFHNIKEILKTTQIKKIDSKINKHGKNNGLVRTVFDFHF